MGYVGGSLVSLFNKEPQKATDLAARRMAEKAGNRMVEMTIVNTPVHRGSLRSSWYQLPTNKTHFAVWPAYKSGVASNVSYAPYVEHGTGLWGPKHAKYEIKPKGGGFLKFIGSDGNEVFARRVMHPGSPGQHMVAIAAEVTEHEANGTLMAGVLHEWAKAVESSAD